MYTNIMYYRRLYTGHEVHCLWQLCTSARHSAQMIKGAGGILDRSMYPAAVYGDETFAVRLTRVVRV